MRLTKMRFSILGAGAVLVLAGLTGCPLSIGHEFIDQPITETRDFSPGGQLTIESLVGDVTVSAWNKNSVSITYRKRVDIFSPLYSPEPDPASYFDQMAVAIEGPTGTGDLTIREVMPVTLAQLYSPSITLDIKMPAHAVLTIVQNVGNVTVTGVHGALDAKVNVGDLTLHHPLPLVSDSIKGTITNVGDINLYLPEGSAFDTNATTQIGRISAEDFWSIIIHRQNTTGASATGHVNGGGADVTLDASIGDIAFVRE